MSRHWDIRAGRLDTFALAALGLARGPRTSALLYGLDRQTFARSSRP
jgi:hypothetical protein